MAGGPRPGTAAAETPGFQPDLSTLVKGDKAFMDRIEQQKRLEEQLARGEAPEDVPAGKIKSREEFNALDRQKGIRPGDHPVVPGHEENRRAPQGSGFPRS